MNNSTKDYQMKKIIYSTLITILLTSCNQQKLLSFITKTPKIEYTKSTNYLKLTKYEKDALYLVELIKQTYPRLYEKIPDFDVKAENFKNSIKANISENKFEIELKKIVSTLKDGHSNFKIDYSKFDKKTFPIFLFKEKGNWIIENIDKSIDSSVIGGKITAINDIPIKEIENRIIELESGENEHWKFLQFRNHSAFPTYWRSLGVISDLEKLKIKIDNDGFVKDFEIESRENIEFHKRYTKNQKYPFRFRQNKGFYYVIKKDSNYGYLQMNTSLDYVCFKSGIDNYTNFLTKLPAVAYMKKDKKDAMDFGKTLQSFFTEIQKDKIDNVIIDLSYNTGGDERTGKQLIWYLTENQHINGFTEYINNSDYFKQQIKVDYKDYNTLYKKKHNRDMPKGEVNITKEIFDEPYFSNITQKGSPFLLDHSLPKFKGKVFVITSPRTFSAGQVLATTISDNKLATLIGQPVGNKPTSQTAASFFKLPNTKKIVAISYTFLERPDTTKNDEKSLYPDVEIHKTFKEFMNGEDPIMNFIINEIKNNGSRDTMRTKE